MAQRTPVRYQRCQGLCLGQQLAVRIPEEGALPVLDTRVAGVGCLAAWQLSPITLVMLDYTAKTSLCTRCVACAASVHGGAACSRGRTVGRGSRTQLSDSCARCGRARV